jgi:hypothetical protein
MNVSRPLVERAPRVALDTRITFRPRHRENVEGVIRDISETGAYLVAMQHLLAGTEVVAYVPIPLGKHKRLCILSGRITRMESNESSALRGYGVKFDADIPPSSRELVQDFVSLQLTGSLPRRRISYVSADELTQERPPGDRVTPARERTQPGRKEASSKERMVRSLKRDTAVRREEMRKRRSRNARILSVSIVLLALFIGGYFVQKFVRKTLYYSSISRTVPLLYPHVTGHKLQAQIGTEWLSSTPPAAKRQLLGQLAERLRERDIYEAIFVNKDGDRVALIMRNLNDPDVPYVSVLK